jgi:hypothetical protein
LPESAPADERSDRDELPPAPPAAPRALTATVKRRAWTETRVRGWWILAAAMLVISVYYAISRSHTWSVERRLITTGERLDAEVMGWAPGMDAPHTAKQVIQADSQVALRYTFRGQTYDVFGPLAGRKQSIYTHTMVPIIVDPGDPTRWTGRLQPAPLVQELLPALLLLPFVVVPFVVALVNRARVLRTYRDGEALLATVVGVGHYAAAPGSRLVRCALHTAGENRVIKTLLPARKTPPTGQSLWLIAPPNRPQQAVPAALFD